MCTSFRETSCHLLSIEDHTDVFESVGNLYWKVIASRLRIDYDMIEEINRDEGTSEDKMMAVLAAWLRRRGKRQEKPSWRSLCVAVQALDKSKAEEIAERHKCDCKECHVVGTRSTHVGMKFQSRNVVHTTKALREEFDELMVLTAKEIREVDLDILRVRITCFVKGELTKVDELIDKHLTKIEDLHTPAQILNYLLRHGFLGYINYTLIAVFQKAARSELLQKHIEEYTKDYRLFLEFSLKDVHRVFKEFPDLHPTCLAGLPTFKIHLEDEWDGRSVYEWKEVLEKRFKWPKDLNIVKIEENCVIIMCAIWPKFAEIVVKDLTDAEVIADLEKEGVTFVLSPQLLAFKQDYNAESMDVMIGSLGVKEEKETELQSEIEHGELAVLELEGSTLSERENVNVSSCTLHKITRAKEMEIFLKNNPTIDVNERDPSFNTPLHYILKKGRPERYGLLMALMLTGRVDVNALDAEENTPLHIAAQKNYYRCGALLIVFNADHLIKNRQNHRPVDLAEFGSPLYKLLRGQSHPIDHSIMTLPCLPDTTAAVDPQEMANERLARLLEPDKVLSVVRKMDEEIELLETKNGVQHQSAGENSTEEDLSKWLQDQKFQLKVWKRTSGSRALFLDGGGMCGLVQIEVLTELEKVTGRKVTELFDWIVGTGTGGVIALGLVYACKTPQQMREMFLNAKNKIFAADGSIDISRMSKDLDEILTVKFGRNPMSSVVHPRVMVCSLNEAEAPPRIVFFNNFMEGTPELTEVPVWKAARACIAAPWYFTACEGKYVDGGVVANNPCELAVNQIVEYDRLMGLPKRQFALVVSVGTGTFANLSLGDRAEFELQNVIQQVDDSAMVAEKFSEWCKNWSDPLPYFRFNPVLQNIVSPGETDDQKLIEIILDSKHYLTEPDTQEKLKHLVRCFKRFHSEKVEFAD